VTSRQAGATIDLAAANSVIRAFGAEHHRAVKSERRAGLKSSLFDVPGRSSLGNMLFYLEAPDLLRTLAEYATPEEIGAAMKVPGSRPYALSHWVVMGAFAEGRQQHYLDLGSPPGEPVDDPRSEDLIAVVDFYVRVGRTYREDGNVFPAPGHLTQAILTPERVEESLALAAEPSPNFLAAVKRTAASLSLHNFLQHGEQRDGIFGHGPYPGPDGTTVWFEEFNDLRNEVLPWSNLEAELPVPNVVFVYAADGVETEANLFGVLRASPFNFHDRLRLAGAFSYADGQATPLDEAALAAISEIAERRHGLLFEQAVGWSDEYRVTYGAPLFANHLIPFFELAGVPGGRDLVLERFEASTPLVMETLRRGIGEGTFWHHLDAVAGEDLYSPARLD
jgi:hypothetical protein